MVSLLASLPYPCCGCCFSKRALAGPASLEREKSETPTHTHQELREGAGGQRRPEADRIGQYEKNSQETREAAKKVAKTTTHTYFFHSCENLCENFPCENQCVCLYTFYVAHIFLRATLLDNESLHCLQLKSFYRFFSAFQNFSLLAVFRFSRLFLL